MVEEAPLQRLAHEEEEEEDAMELILKGRDFMADSRGRTGLKVAALLFLFGGTACAIALCKPLRRATEDGHKVANAAGTVGLFDHSLMEGHIEADHGYSGGDQELDHYFKEMMGGFPDNPQNPDYTASNPNDGNICLDGEEHFGGLCYKTCALLTGGKYPVRTTGWTCCEEHPCYPWNSKRDIGICSGFSVSGDGKSCPRRPGACYQDEEFLWTFCYKKCSLLTNDRFPHRVFPTSCCNTKGADCFNPMNLDTSEDYNVCGGPHGGGHPHPPLIKLTEEINAEEAEVA